MPVDNLIKLTPSQIPAMLRTCIEIHQPVIIWGGPGTSKSSLVHQTAASMDRRLLDVRAALKDPVDFIGVPFVEKGRSFTATPSFWPNDGRGIIFLDELNRASTMVQNASFQLVLDRAIGEYKLPDGWSVVSACNREEDGGGIQRMSAALVNRFLHIHLEPSLDDFCDYAVANDWSSDVIAFLKKFQPQALYEFDRNSKAWPSPRSWGYVNKLIQSGVPRNLELAMYSGAVGQGRAIEFLSYLELRRKLPDVTEILRDPKGSKVPSHEDPSVKYAIVVALSQYCKSSDNRSGTGTKNFNPAVEYVRRFKTASGNKETEYLVMLMHTAQSVNSAVAGEPAFTKLAGEIHNLL